MSQKQQQLPDKKTFIPKQTFALLFCEIVQYCHQKADSLDQFSQQLADMGYPIGCTLLEVIEQSNTINYKRQTKAVQMLLQVKDQIWKYLFGYAAHDLQQQYDDANNYMLYDNKPMITEYISHPQEIKKAFTCCSFVAGIVQGILNSAGFKCKVTAHPNPDDETGEGVIFLIKFEESYA